jgi:hypothetical protein
MLMKRARWLLGMFLSASISIAYGQVAPTAEPQLKVRSFPDFTAQALVPRCAEISDMGSGFALLVNACQYALSPESLPNLVCEETIQRSTNGFPYDVVTEEVTFVNGVDHYSNLAVNGTPVSKVNDNGVWNSNALFGTVLHAVLCPTTKSRFTFPNKSDATRKDFSQCNFQYFRSPVFNLDGSDPALSGSIWVARSTGLLARIESTANRIDPLMPLKSYRSVIDYHNVLIANLGYVQLPTEAAVQACTTAACYRNVAAFHGCRKFAGQVQIVPNPQ